MQMNVPAACLHRRLLVLLGPASRSAARFRLLFRLSFVLTRFRAVRDGSNPLINGGKVLRHFAGRCTLKCLADLCRITVRSSIKLERLH